MTKIAFIGHSHHQLTQSSNFFLKILNGLGTVTIYWDSSWNGQAKVDIEQILKGGFDIIIAYQIEHHVPHLVRSGHPNIVFVPMFDSCRQLPAQFWQLCAGVKVVAFSSTVYRIAQEADLNARYFKFFPNPEGYPVVSFADGLRAFLWQRRQEVTAEHASVLLKNVPLRSFHLHSPADPMHASAPPLSWTQSPHTSSTWFPDRDSYLSVLNRHNIFIAPRLYEGIGMSFLEAMASGMAIIAPDNPTMDEYIVHGETGLLFDPNDCRPLELPNAQEMGQKARRIIAIGYQRWLKSVPVLEDYILRPIAQLKTRSITFPAVTEALIPDQPKAPRSSQGPLITIATVVLNAPEALETTLVSVQGQSYRNIEHLIIDGGSGSPTKDVINRHASKIARWISETDSGPFDAMNKAAKMANGHWILYLNAGDTFAFEHTLEEIVRFADPEADIVYGHHIYHDARGVERIHWVSGLQASCQSLKAGLINDRWLHGIPCHQSTLTKPALLRQYPYDLRYRISADHDFLYRVFKQKARFGFVDVIVARYMAGGLSWRYLLRCEREWLQVARRHADSQAHEKIDLMFAVRIEYAAEALLNRTSFKQLPRLLAHMPSVLKTKVFYRYCGEMSRQFFAGRRTVVYFDSTQRRPSFSRSCSVSGLSSPEPWGSWSDGAEIRVVFHVPVQPGYTIRLNIARVFDPNIDQNLKVVSEDGTHNFPLGKREQLIDIKCKSVPVRNFVVHIPRPTTPASLGWSTDQRQLGIGLHSLSVSRL